MLKKKNKKANNPIIMLYIIELASNKLRVLSDIPITPKAKVMIKYILRNLNFFSTIGLVKFLRFIFLLF
tara:strand:- start:255 stop:461 length:207 start_codon:yes stop_codon:yes gene_type:complete